MPIIIVHDPEGLEVPETQWGLALPPPQKDPVHSDPAPQIKIVVTDSDEADVLDLT